MAQLLYMLEAIQAMRNPVMDHLFVWITVLGEEYFAIAVLCFILWCLNKKLGYKIGFAYLTTWILNFSVKEIFHVQRPFALDKNITPIRPETATGWSFPSGHTQSIASLSAAIATAFRKKWVVIAGAVLVVLMGFSRMYLGVHTLLDVGVAAVMGIAWVFAADGIFYYVEKINKPALLLFMLIPMAGALVFVHDPDYYKIAGTFTSFVIGYVLDARFIRYDAKSGSVQQAVKLVIGLAVLVAIKELGKKLMGDSLAADYIRYLIIGFWITVLAPLLYKKLLSEKPAKTPVGGN